MTPCRGVGGEQQSGEGEKIGISGGIFILKMEALCPLETPGMAYRTTWRYKTQDTQTLSAGNKNQLYAQFILSSFRQSTSTGISTLRCAFRKITTTGNQQTFT